MLGGTPDRAQTQRYASEFARRLGAHLRADASRFAGVHYDRGAPDETGRSKLGSWVFRPDRAMGTD